MSARGRRELIAGAAITGSLLALALLALVWTPGPTGGLRIALKLRPPLDAGLLGTDQLGRDVASLLMAGAFNSLSVAASAVTIGGSLGTLAGLLAAGRGTLAETAVMRLSDILFALPPILSAMMLGALLGGGRLTAVIAIASFILPVFARLAFAGARQCLARDYCLAARAAGKGGLRIALEHVLPNIAGQLAVQATLQLGLAMLTEAGLSFLGLGAPPPSPSWGRMLADSQTYLATAPWLAIGPGAAIAVAVLGFNLLGDGLAERLDPRGDRR